MATELVIDLDPTRAPVGAQSTRPTAYDPDEVHPKVGGSISSVRQEVDDAFADMATFYQQDPDNNMRLAGGHTARLSHLRVLIMRIENSVPHREWINVRTRDIEPCIEELERQYRNASRLEAVRELDWKIESGAR